MKTHAIDDSVDGDIWYDDTRKMVWVVTIDKFIGNRLAALYNFMKETETKAQKYKWKYKYK